jgi:hypothetical protein
MKSYENLLGWEHTLQIRNQLIKHNIANIVINYINLFVFDDEIEIKNRSTIQTLTFVQANPDHLYMKRNMKLVKDLYNLLQYTVFYGLSGIQPGF